MRLLVVATLLLVTLAARSAYACSAQGPCPYAVGETLPRHGTSGIPTNTEIDVLYQGPQCSCVGPDTWRLRTVDGVEVALAPSSVAYRMRPLEALTPFTAYELLALVPDRSSTTECTFGEGLVVVATFETGAGPDTTPPPPPAPSPPSCTFSTCDSGGCCGPYELTVSIVSWPAVIDDTEWPVAYAEAGSAWHTYETRAGDWSYVGAPHYPSPPLGVVPWSGRGAEPRLVAIDSAGNVSEPSEPYETDLSCAPIDEPDASLADASIPDAGLVAPDAAAGPPRASGGPGCSIARRATPLPVALLVLAAHAFVRSARRARSRSAARAS